MPSKALALIVHPVRLRIIQALVRRERTTHQIAEALPDVPVSSLYRYLRLLLEGGYIEIASTRSVNGIEEKTYRLSDSKPALLADHDFEGLDKAGLQQAFSLLTGMILTSFQAYLDATPDPDWKRDRLGCAEFTFLATPDEYDALWKQIWSLLQSAEAQSHTAGRVPRKVAIAGYPGVTDADNGA
ncbi:MAG: helix-turn-helix domain-containing protein [Chloroflexi bacterium]|nr:helix-turn-helix domain-containing protein [Chloroflexota bacterium]